MPDTAQRNYQKLTNELSQLIARTLVTGTQSLNQDKLKAYWDIGFKLGNLKKLTSDFTIKLANDLNIKPDLLYRSNQFYLNWPKGLSTKALRLSWSTHLVLSTVGEKKARDFYLDQCLKNGWSRDSLRNAIKKNYFDAPDTKKLPAVKLPAGFNLYPALVKKVVDGDTLDTLIDVGFHMWSNQRLRLKGINCAELKSGGAAARQFIIDTLKDIPFIVVKTHKTDIYGRYLANVYFHPTLTKKEEIVAQGTHLNQLLLDKGLAKPMMV